MPELYDLEGVLHAVEEPLGQPPHLIVREVHPDQREVGGREELGAEGLDAGVPLGKLLDVEPVGEEGELGEDGAIAVDPGGVDAVEAALARVVERRVELAARDLDGGRGLGLGVMSLIGRFVGARDMERTNQVISSGFVLALGYSGILSVLFLVYRVELIEVFATGDEHFADIDGVTWTHPTGGLYVWLTLPEPVRTSRDSKLFEQALNEGVLYVPGDYCYPIDPTREAPTNLIRLAVGVPSIDAIREGVARLARAVNHVLA